MKKRYLFSVFGILFFNLVCVSQEIGTPITEANGAYFVKAKVDGKEVIFNTENHIDGRVDKIMDGLYQGAIRGEIPDPGPDIGIIESIGITIGDSKQITEGIYTNVEPFEYGLKGVILGYANAELGTIGFVTNPNNPDSYLSITKLNAQYIQGVFRGTVFDLLSGKTLSITDGEFYVPRLH